MGKYRLKLLKLKQSRIFTVETVTTFSGSKFDQKGREFDAEDTNYIHNKPCMKY